MLNIQEDFVVFLWKMVPLNVVWLLYTAWEPHVVGGSNLDHSLIVWLRLKPLVLLPTTYTLLWLLLVLATINCSQCCLELSGDYDGVAMDW